MRSLEQENQINEFEKLYLKIFGKASLNITTRYQITQLKHLADMWIDEYFDKLAMNHRLEREPKGFHLDKNGKSCCICGRHMKAESSWFDKIGLRCITCKKAIDDKVIPENACRHKENWYTEEEFKEIFEVDDQTIEKIIKSGELKPRNIIALDGKSLWFRIFIDKENTEVKYEYAIKMLTRLNERIDAKQKEKAKNG